MYGALPKGGWDEMMRVKSLWVRIEGQVNRGGIVVGVYYKPLDREEEVDDAF